MTGAPITALWTALIALWVGALVLRVVLLRFRLRVGLGDGGNAGLLRAIRVHANAIETQPLALLLMLLYELGGGLPWLLHGCGALLLGGRLLHAWGLTSSPGTSVGRFLGTATWITVIVTLGALDLVRAWPFH